MNLMSKRIQIQNITKYKIGIGMTVIVFVGLSMITDWWMAMAIYGNSGMLMGIFVHWWKLPFDGKQSKININSNF